MSKNKSYERIKTTLEKYANEGQTKKAVEYIESHKAEIAKIIDLFGSGNSYISSAYDISYQKHDFSFAEEYERKLESIQSNALFDDQ